MSMDKKVLEEKKLSIEQQFNATSERVSELNQQIKEAGEEALRLQGEYRLVNEILNSYTEVTEAIKETKRG